jgi:hypothetical protein
MSANLSRYEADLNRFVENGTLLLTAMQYEQHRDQVTEQIKNAYGDKSEQFIKDLPRFSSSYQPWYSEAKAVVRQIIPDRLSDFVRHY